MRDEERTLFETFAAVHPGFLEMRTWEPGPPNEPPDVILTDPHGRRIGVELTEWLDEEQTSRSVPFQDSQYEWIALLDAKNRPRPANFAWVQVYFRPDAKKPAKKPGSQELLFRQEFLRLMDYIDDAWDREMAGQQKFWIDFSDYPALAKRIRFLRFEDRSDFQPAIGWIIGTHNRGAFDPRSATAALLARIDAKRKKPNYPRVKESLGLAELILLVHYGVRGLSNNSPFDGMNWTLHDSVREARAEVAQNPGPFDRIFLYLALNEGPLLTCILPKTRVGL